MGIINTQIIGKFMNCIDYIENITIEKVKNSDRENYQPEI